MDIINKFLHSRWMTKASKCIKSPSTLLKLALSAGTYIKKNGLHSVKDHLTLMGDYIRDVATGHYKDYSKGNLTLIVAAVLYVVSPLDIIPDFLIVAGLIDDAAIIAWAFNEMNKELTKYQDSIKKEKELQKSKKEEIEE